jgi:hypothetical protein
MSRDSIVSVRFTASELGRLRAVAERSGRTMSDVLRAVAESLCRDKQPDLPATIGSYAPAAPMIVWDNGVAGSNYKPAASW